MATAHDDRLKQTKFHAKVTGRHAITLPAELCRQLDIRVGDRVELERDGETATLRRVPDNPIPAARGLLRGYFSSWEDVNRFVEEERRGWDERERRLMGEDVP